METKSFTFVGPEGKVLYTTTAFATMEEAKADFFQRSDLYIRRKHINKELQFYEDHFGSKGWECHENYEGPSAR